MRTVLPEGTNLRLLLVHCTCESAGLTAHSFVADQVVRAIKTCDMTPLTSVGHDFTGAGYSLCVLLAESHLVIHTYPECSRSVIVELSVCDYQRANEGRALQLAHAMVEIFRPGQLIQEQSQMRPRSTFGAGSGQQVALDVEELLAQRQRQILVMTPRLGKTLIDGGHLVACDLDEPWVIEPLVHVPLLLHPAPQKVVLYAGGGHTRGELEILRHPSVEQLIILEDREPLAASPRPLDPRLEYHLGDPRDFSPAAPVDLVILDLSASADLTLLDRARSWLAPGGLWGARLPEVALSRGEGGALGIPAKAQAAFYWQHLPSTGRSLFAVSMLSLPRVPDRAEWARRLEQRGIAGLQVITPETLEAMFALPPLLDALIAPFMVSSAHE